MTQDIKFDINKMEVIVENGDFAINTNVSEQNGAMIMYTKNMNLAFPGIGVGLIGILNSGLLTIQNYLNRWAAQVQQDGSKSATWKIEGSLIKTTCDYE
jgi:hypothetical protein